MESWHRPFAYLTGSLVFGLLVIVLTNGFLGYVNTPGWIGYVALLAYGLVFVNIGYVLNRRFTKKIKQPTGLSYAMAALLIGPTLLWVLTKDGGGALGESRMVFILTVVFAAFLGTWYGIKTGSRKRVDYLRKMREQEDEEVPDELKRPHDDLQKN